MLTARERRPSRRLAPLALLAAAAAPLALWGCAGRTALAPPREEPVVEVEAVRADDPRASLKRSVAKAQQLAAKGQHRAALVAYRTLHATAPEDPGVRAGYRDALRALWSAAEAEEGRGDFAAAGRSYRFLLDGLPRAELFAAPPPFDGPALRRKVDSCAEQLTRAGLRLYRQGEIQEAIARWQAVLTFDPARVEVRKAIDDATAQARTLETGDAAGTTSFTRTPGR